jgi:hypothetical protein
MVTAGLAKVAPKWPKTTVFRAFFVVSGHPFGYTERTAGTTSAFQI